MIRKIIKNYLPIFKKSRNFSTKNIQTKEKETDKVKVSGIIFVSSIISSYILYKNVNQLDIENISIKDFSDTKNINDYEKITVVDEKNVFIKERDKNKFLRVNVPNIEYFEKHVDTDLPIYFETSTKWASFIGPMISLGILGTVLYVMTKNTGGLKNIMDVSKPVNLSKDIKIKFKDIIGQDNAKKSVEEFVDIVKNKEKYRALGVNVPRGALLTGPPGTGKTLLAKAIAGECNIPFVNMTGSDFNAMFVGVGSSKVKNLFKTARESAKENNGCIIFIDEIDAIGQKRSSVNTFGGNSERENTLNQILTEMDGFVDNDNVLTFAATNRPELLDPALLRPGRFDRKINVDLPSRKDRKELFQYYFEKLTIDKSIINNLSDVSSRLTPGFSGADISNITNESGIIAVRKGKQLVEEDDVKEAIDYVMMGNTKGDILSDKEKEIVSFHEAGHALLSHKLDLMSNPIKVSIIPRERGMLGFSQSETSDDNLTSKKKMKQYLNVLMAGRAAEEIYCEDVTNGASNDIEKATEIAEQYVKLFGFSDKNKFMKSSSSNPYKSDISEKISGELDEEIMNLLNLTYDETVNIIKNHEDRIIALKNELIDKETIYKEDIDKILDN